VLVPALMLLLGRTNWAFPGFLDRILPRFNVEGESSAHEPVPAPVGS
jgi:RND superfamily putative drug exporter